MSETENVWLDFRVTTKEKWINESTSFVAIALCQKTILFIVFFRVFIQKKKENWTWLFVMHVTLMKNYDDHDKIEREKWFWTSSPTCWIISIFAENFKVQISLRVQKIYCSDIFASICTWKSKRIFQVKFESRQKVGQTYLLIWNPNPYCVPFECHEKYRAVCVVTKLTAIQWQMKSIVAFHAILLAHIEASIYNVQCKRIGTHTNKKPGSNFQHKTLAFHFRCSGVFATAWTL